MTLRSSFFNSINGDRRYDARIFAKYFASLIANGIFPDPSTGLQVYEASNMQTRVRAGLGWINGYFLENDSDFYLNHDNADGVLKRIDRIVMRLNHINRLIEIVVKKGGFSSIPVPPDLQRDADFYELALADVYIGNGVTEITQANITDLRLNNNLCGIVHGLVNQVDTTTLYNQYEAWFDTWSVQQQEEFEAWLESIKDLLDGDVAANIAQAIGDLSQLNTTDKSSLVNAVNEVNRQNFDFEYQTPVINGNTIALTRQSDTNRLFFKLDTDLSIDNIAISLDGFNTDKPLIDIYNRRVSKIKKGFIEVFETETFFTYVPKGDDGEPLGPDHKMKIITSTEPASRVGAYTNATLIGNCYNEKFYFVKDTKFISKYSAVNASLIGTITLPYLIIEVVCDNDFLYVTCLVSSASGITTNKLYKIAIDTLQIVSESTNFNTNSDSDYPSTMMLNRNGEGDFVGFVCYYTSTFFSLSKDTLQVVATATHAITRPPGATTISPYLDRDNMLYVFISSKITKLNMATLSMIAQGTNAISGQTYNFVKDMNDNLWFTSNVPYKLNKTTLAITPVYTTLVELQSKLKDSEGDYFEPATHFLSPYNSGLSHIALAKGRYFFFCLALYKNSEDYYYNYDAMYDIEMDDLYIEKTGYQGYTIGTNSYFGTDTGDNVWAGMMGLNKFKWLKVLD